MENDDDLAEKIASAKQLYAGQNYDECSSLVQVFFLSFLEVPSQQLLLQLFQDCLSDAAHDKHLLGELHLLLAKCHRGKSDLKSAILSCQSSIEARPKWPDPFLYRSACFQALHQFFLETDGDISENIDKDRSEADVVVRTSEELVAALKSNVNGNTALKIFLEKGNYEAKSLFVCGKNVSIIGASVKDCILEFRYYI